MIKKITPLMAVFCLIFNSCTTDIEINSPALQATIDGKLFRPDIKKAILHDDGTLVIMGIANSEIISFTTSSLNEGTYKLSQQAISHASFEDNSANSTFISKENISIGEVRITEIYNNEITGNFFFTNLKSDDGKSVSFQNGWFYRLPVENYEAPKDEENNTINPCLLNASLTASIDGVEMITDDHQAAEFGVRPPYPSIRITASDDAQDIEIVFSIDATPGQYSLSGSGEYSASYALNNEKTAAASGILTIVEHNQDTKCISGSFEFTTQSGVKVTGGNFDFGY